MFSHFHAFYLTVTDECLLIFWNIVVFIWNVQFIYMIMLCSFVPPLDVAACNITLNVTDTRQYLATEGYPHRYQNDQDCYFNFEAPIGRRVVVFFEHIFLVTGRDFLILRELLYMDTLILTLIHKINSQMRGLFIQCRVTVVSEQRRLSTIISVQMISQLNLYLFVIKRIFFSSLIYCYSSSSSSATRRQEEFDAWLKTISKCLHF